MNEIRVPLVVTLKLDDLYLTLRVCFLRKDEEPYLLIQLEPLFH